MIDLVAYPYPVGTIVAIGGSKPVEGPVTALPGPYSVEIGGRLIASITLITASRAGETDDGFLPNDPAPENQLFLF